MGAFCKKLSLPHEQVVEIYIMSHIVALILVNAQNCNVGHTYVQNELFVILHSFMSELNIDFQDNARQRELFIPSSGGMLEYRTIFIRL